MTCQATQHGDQMMCRCGLAWDINDPEIPACRASMREPEDRALDIAPLNAPDLVRKMARGPLNRVETAARCALARAAYDEGIKEAYRAVRCMLK